MFLIPGLFAFHPHTDFTPLIRIGAGERDGVDFDAETEV